MTRFKPVKVLLVEDDPNDVEIARRAFERGRVVCTLSVLRDGQEVVDAIQTPDRLFQPDVILLDLNLPRLNGLETLQAIRASSRLALTPVVVLSASARQEDVDRSYALGANSYIQKPVVFDEFREGLGVLAHYWFALASLPRAGREGRGMTGDDVIRVLVVDDNADDTRMLRHLLAKCGRIRCRVSTARSTSTCLRQLEAEGADLVLLDYRLPGEDGLSFLRRRDEIELPPVIIMTGHGDERTAVEAIRLGACDFYRKDTLTAESLGQLVETALVRFRAEEERSRFDEQIMVALAAAAEGKDATTGGHLHRMSHLAMLVGCELGMTDQQLQVLRAGTLLHDIGKLAVRGALLTKPAPLSEDEWEEMRQHPLVGERMCGGLRRARQVGSVIRHHHERWDGTGYPDGLAATQVPYLARVVSVVDAFDAMANDRPYRKALPPREVVRRLERGAGTQWDPQVTQVFLELVERDALDRRDRKPARPRTG